MVGTLGLVSSGASPRVSFASMVFFTFSAASFEPTRREVRLLLWLMKTHQTPEPFVFSRTLTPTLGVPHSVLTHIKQRLVVVFNTNYSKNSVSVIFFYALDLVRGLPPACVFLFA